MMRARLVLLITSLVLVCLVAGNELTAETLSQEHEQAMAERMQQSPAMATVFEYPKLSNLCLQSRIRATEKDEFNRFSGNALVDAIDGDPETSVRLSKSEESWLEVQFLGSRKWVNFVTIQHSDPGSFQLEVLDWYGNRRSVETLSAVGEPIRDGRQRTTVEFRATQARGIRLTLDPASEVPADVFEFSACFEQHDPDDRPEDDPDDEGMNWILTETAVTSYGIAEITAIHSRVAGLADWCQMVPHWCHRWLPGADWAGDFANLASGGGEHLHTSGYTGMDWHDLAVICCHGIPGRIRFSVGPAPASHFLRPSYITWSWGNMDAEWFCALSCSAYDWDPPNNWPWQWADGFGGAHLQCGFTTTAYTHSSGSFLGGFADLMISSAAFDPAVPVAISWFLASALWQPASTCALVVSDSAVYFSDYLWGEGWVHGDPPVPRAGLYWAVWDPPYSAKAVRDNSIPPSMTEEERQFVQRALAGDNFVYLPAQSPQGVPVIANQNLLTGARQDSIPVYTLSPNPVDVVYIQNLADDLCANYGIMCAPEIGQDADGNWWATEDEYVLWANPDNGAVQFVNVNEYVAIKPVAPTLPDPSQASAQAMNLLNDLGLMVGGPYLTSHTYNVQTAYDPGVGEIVADSSFDVSINAEFVRIVDGYNVFGPGGYIAVTVGEGYEIQHFTRNGWHDLVSPSWETIMNAVDAMELLTTYGEVATIGGIPPIGDTLLIETAELAYYNTNGEYETDILEPIYHMYCWAVSEYDTVPCNIFVPARLSLLRGHIDEPAHGSTFEEGETVTLVGSASGGASPYTYVWYSMHDGVLGMGNPLMTSSLTPVYKGDVVAANQVNLKVRDAAGDSTVVSIHLYIEPAFVCGDADGNEVVNVADAVHLINYIFGGGPPPDPLEAGDVNCDGIVNVADVVYMIGYIFGGGPEPCDPDGDGMPDC